jgi:hypothetical protein
MQEASYYRIREEMLAGQTNNGSQRCEADHSLRHGVLLDRGTQLEVAYRVGAGAYLNIAHYLPVVIQRSERACRATAVAGDIRPGLRVRLVPLPRLSVRHRQCRLPKRQATRRRAVVVAGSRLWWRSAKLTSKYASTTIAQVATRKKRHRCCSSVEITRTITT